MSGWSGGTCRIRSRNGPKTVADLLLHIRYDGRGPVMRQGREERTPNRAAGGTGARTMDKQRFDAALRALQAGTTRRRGLGTALGVLLGGAITS